jgi:hypothetical protein
MTEEASGEGGGGEPPIGGEETLTIDAIVERLEGLPKASRDDFAFRADVITFASTLDDIGLARLKRRLQATGFKIQDWARGVVARRKEAEREENEERRERAKQQRPDDRPEIVIDALEEHEVNAAALRALATHGGVYQRLGSLVRVVDARRRRPGEAEPYVLTEIRAITHPYLRQLFTETARWRETRTDRDAMTIRVPAHPPDWCVRAVFDWQAWPSVRPLYHFADAPVLLHDGDLLQRDGYDAATGTLLKLKFTIDSMPDELTKSDAVAAAAELRKLLVDFPFENPAREGAWFAALLTPIARWAFEGQAPIYVFDANVEGVGKGYLLKAIGHVALGHEMDFVVQTADEEEERKRITSKVLSGAPMVLIDEIGRPFGSPALQALLTSGVWGERLLGGNDAPRLDVWITWYAAGNNIEYKTNDIRRRSCVIRLVTDQLRPEQRTGFTIPNFLRYVRENRPALFRAALVMLRAWLTSGQAPEALEGWGGPWGGVDDWDRVVRGAIVYAGIADPVGAKATADAASAQPGLVDLVAGLEEAANVLGLAEGHPREVTAGELFKALEENDEWRRASRYGGNIPPVRFAKLREAFAALLPVAQRGALPSSRQIGTLLGRMKQKPVPMRDNETKRIDGRLWEGDTRWRVDIVTTAGASGACGGERPPQPDPADDYPRE